MQIELALWLLALMYGIGTYYEWYVASFPKYGHAQNSVGELRTCFACLTSPWRCNVFPAPNWCLR